MYMHVNVEIADAALASWNVSYQISPGRKWWCNQYHVFMILEVGP